MNRFTSGMITGGLIGAIGIAYALNDKRSRKRMVRSGKKMATRAGSIINDLKDSVW